MSCYNSIVVQAPSNKVWDALKKFHDMSWSANVIGKLDIIGEKSGNEIGVKRVLNDAIHETLLSLDDASKSFSYGITDGPAVLSKENVEGYVGKVSVFDVTADNTSFVVWTANWQSSVEEGIEEFVNPIYQALLQDLSGHFS